MTPAELRAWRTTRKLSQSRLADLLGVHWTTVQRWERAEREIPGFLGLALESLARRIPAYVQEFSAPIATAADDS